MKYPKRLTDEEWNLLQDLTTHNHMDVWFELRGTKRGDYVYDREEECKMNLHDAIEQVAEGMWSEDLKLFDDGVNVWNGMMERFGLKEHRV